MTINRQPLMLRDIEEAVTVAFNIERADLFKRNRSRQFAWPRQVVFYLARQLTILSLPQIGAAFELDHTTVLWGVEQTTLRLAKNTALRARVELARQILSEIEPYSARIARQVGDPPALVTPAAMMGAAL